MGEFNEGVWRRRALKRRRGDGTRSLTGCLAARFVEDSTAIDGLVRVVDWCRREGVRVLFVKRADALLDPANRAVYVSSACRPRTALYYLLHEVGHLIVGETYSTLTDERRARSAVYRRRVLCEEIAAWDEGLALAERLGVRVEPRAWERVSAVALMTYVKWAAGECKCRAGRVRVRRP